MKRLFFLLITFAGALNAHTQSLPTLTNGTQFKVIKSNETWMTTLADIVAFVNAGTGTVTSVDVSGGSTGLTTSGGPVTTTGTITLSGTLDADNGGTGQSTVTQGDLLYGSASNVWSKLAKNTSATRYLSNTGTSNNPAWAQVNLADGVTGTLPVANGGTGLTALGGSGTVLGSNGSTNVYFNPTITTTSAAIAYAVNGSNLELNIPNADASFRGTVSTGSQTMAGAKTWSALGTFSAGATATSAAGAAAFYSNGVSGGKWDAYTATQTLDETNRRVEIGTQTAAITFNLPACNATRNGWEYKFIKTGSDNYGSVLDPNGSETFTDGATTKTIYSLGNTAVCSCRWNGSVGTWFFEQ